MRLIFTHIAVFVLLLTAGQEAAGQVLPKNFPVNNNPGDFDAIYTAEGAQEEKVLFHKARQYFLPEINVLESEAAPDSTGNTNYGQLVRVESTGNLYYIDGTGRSVLVEDLSSLPDTLILATRYYLDSLYNELDSLRAAGEKKAPILIPVFDRNTQLNNCATSSTVYTGFLLIDDTAIDESEITFEINASPATVTYDLYNQDSTAYYFETGTARAAGIFFWEVGYTDADGNFVGDMNSFNVIAGRADTVTVFDPTGQDSILVTRVCGTEISRDTVSTGEGSVTSVSLSLPSQFAVTGSPVTGSGTLTGAWNTQTANTILAGPASGAAAAPTFRSLVSADITTAGGALGTGTTNYISKWASPDALTNSLLYDNGSSVGINTASPGASLQVNGEASAVTSIFRANATTPGNLTQWESSAGAVLSRITAEGRYQVFDPDQPLGYTEFFHDHANNNSNYPRTYLYGYGQGAATVNYGMYFASKRATGTTQNPAFVGVSTNTDVKQVSSVQAAMYVDVTKMAIYNALAENTYRAVPIYIGALTSPDICLATSGNTGFGTTSPSYKVDISSTGGMRIPVGTDAQDPTGARGVIRYSTTQELYKVYRDAGWAYLPWMNSGLTQMTAKNYVFNIDQSTTGIGGLSMQWNETNSEAEFSERAHAVLYNGTMDSIQTTGASDYDLLKGWLTFGEKSVHWTITDTSAIYSGPTIVVRVELNVGARASSAGNHIFQIGYAPSAGSATFTIPQGAAEISYLMASPNITNVHRTSQFEIQNGYEIKTRAGGVNGGIGVTDGGILISQVN